MTNLKLTNGQIEAIRALSAELFEKLESGEAVTLERAVEKWEPEGGEFYIWGAGRVGKTSEPGDRFRLHGSERKTGEQAERLANDQRIFNRLHAYREEFAPGYVVPPLGEMAWYPILGENGQYRPVGHVARSPTAIYMPYDICLDLCRKLNSGEVVL